MKASVKPGRLQWKHAGNIVDSDPEDPYVFGPSGSVIIYTDRDVDPDPSINMQKSKKNLNFYLTTF